MSETAPTDEVMDAITRHLVQPPEPSSKDAKDADDLHHAYQAWLLTEEHDLCLERLRLLLELREMTEEILVADEQAMRNVIATYREAIDAAEGRADKYVDPLDLEDEQFCHNQGGVFRPLGDPSEERLAWVTEREEARNRPRAEATSDAETEGLSEPEPRPRQGAPQLSAYRPSHVVFSPYDTLDDLLGAVGEPLWWSPLSARVPTAAELRTYFFHVLVWPSKPSLDGFVDVASFDKAYVAWQRCEAIRPDVDAALRIGEVTPKHVELRAAAKWLIRDLRSTMGEANSMHEAAKSFWRSRDQQSPEDVSD